MNEVVKNKKMVKIITSKFLKFICYFFVDKID